MRYCNVCKCYQSNPISGQTSLAYDKLVLPIRDPLVVSVTAEQKGFGSIPGSGKVLLGFSISIFSVTVTESRFVPV